MRMLRAVRFAAKLDFGIEKHSATPIRQLAPMLRDIPSARLFEEVLKLFLSGHGARHLRDARRSRTVRATVPGQRRSAGAQPDYTAHA